MAQPGEAAAVIAALGAPPRSFPPEATAEVPRAKGKLAPAIGALAFGGLLFIGLAGGLSDPMTREYEQGRLVMVGLAALLMEGLGSWLIIRRAQIIATTRDLLIRGRATRGIVESVEGRRMGATTRADYQFAYTDAAGGRRVLKTFWLGPDEVFPQGAEVVILHDPEQPDRAAVFPLDYPGVRLSAPAADPADDMMATLARLGVPLDFGQSSPQGALMGGVVKAGLYQGIRKLHADALDEAVESFSAVLQTAERAGGFEKVRAVIHEQRGTAHEKKGATALARADYEAALRLDPQRTAAAAGLSRTGAS